MTELTMLRLCGLFAVALALALAVGVTAGQDKTATAKGEKEVAGKIKEISVAKKSFTLMLDDKTERTFLVSKETKFTGPRGSDRDEGLLDPCMSEGYPVQVVPAADDKHAKEVKLSLWKGDTGKKKGKKGG